MEELSNFLENDNDQDEDDYIPESLASFVAEANKTLAAAKLNFLTQDDGVDDDLATNRSRNQSMDTTNTTTVVLVEDDEDIRLKRQLLDKLRTTTSQRQTPSSFLASPDESIRATGRQHHQGTSKKLFAEVPVGKSAFDDDEDVALEMEISSFLRDDIIVPKVAVQQQEHQTGKIDDTAPTRIAETSTPAKSTARTMTPTTGNKGGNATTTPLPSAKQRDTKKGDTNNGSTNSSSKPSFWGSLTSTFAITPATKQSSGTSTTGNKARVSPDLQKAMEQEKDEEVKAFAGMTLVSEVKIETEPFDEPMAPVLAAAAVPTKELPTPDDALASMNTNVPIATTILETQVTEHVDTSCGQPITKMDQKQQDASKSPAAVEAAVPRVVVGAVETGKASTPTTSEPVTAKKNVEKQDQPGNITKTPKLMSSKSVTVQKEVKKRDQPNTPDDASFLPPASNGREDPYPAPMTPDHQAFLSPIPTTPDASTLTPPTTDDAIFLPNNDRAKRTIPPKPVPKLVPPPTLTTTKVSTKAVARQKVVTTPSIESSRLITATAARVGHSSSGPENRRNTTQPADAIAKARERVRQRQLMEKKKREEEPATTKREPLVTATRAMRTSNKIAPVGSAKESIVTRKPEANLKALMKAEEERRARVAEKVRSTGSGITIPKAPRLSSSTRTRPPTVPTPAQKSTNMRPQLTTPEPFHFHGKDPVRNVRDDNSDVCMTEYMNEFMRKGLRHSTPTARFENRPKITTPKPFTFDETTTQHVTPAATMEIKRKTSTLGEKLVDYNMHLRDSGPPIVVIRDEGPTIPMSPKFTPIPSREKPKSTMEREAELMEYYESHPFKAAPILTELPNSGRGLVGLPKVSKKKLTVPKPFRLATEARGLQGMIHRMPSKDESDGAEPKNQTFKARSMPQFNAPQPTSSVSARLTAPGRASKAGGISPRMQTDDEDYKAPFQARPMPDFKAGSKLTPVLPKRLNSLRANFSKAEKVNVRSVPTTIEVRKGFSLGGARVAPSPLGSPLKSPLNEEPSRSFRLAPTSRSLPVADPNEEELKKQFKARPLPLSTFLPPPSSIGSPSRGSRVPSTISISSAPKLATEERREQREAAMLASRINAELMIRERASRKQRKQEEKHKEEMRKAALVSPTKLKAESMAPFQLSSSVRQEASQKKLKDQWDEEERERLRNFEMKASPIPNLSLSPTKPY